MIAGIIAAPFIVMAIVDSGKATQEEHRRVDQHNIDAALAEAKAQMVKKDPLAAQLFREDRISANTDLRGRIEALASPWFKYRRGGSGLEHMTDEERFDRHRPTLQVPQSIIQEAIDSLMAEVDNGSDRSALRYDSYWSAVEMRQGLKDDPDYLDKKWSARLLPESDPMSESMKLSSMHSWVLGGRVFSRPRLHMTTLLRWRIYCRSAGKC